MQTIGIIARLAAASVGKINDGRWHNLCGHERQEAEESVLAVWKEWLGFGCAQALGWVEVNDTWARITPKGQRALNDQS